jgi:hypothetical protein
MPQGATMAVIDAPARKGPGYVGSSHIGSATLALWSSWRRK